jgi:hypothetical protein
MKSPDAPILSEQLIKQLIVLIQFLEKDESEFQVIDWNHSKMLIVISFTDLRQEGLFRKTGSVSRQQELKFLVNQLKPLNLDEFTCHDVASVMKSILADLPEPLLTEV